jgi:hypothetical protein
MRIFKRLLRITRAALLAILAVYAGTALVLVNLADPKFKPATSSRTTPATSEMFKPVFANESDKFTMRDIVTKNGAGEVVLIEGATHDGICYNGEAMAAAGNWLAKNGFAKANLSAR